MRTLLLLLLTFFLPATKKDNTPQPGEIITNENPATYKEVAPFNAGSSGAAEISAYLPQPKRLFAVNSKAVNKIDVTVKTMAWLKIFKRTNCCKTALLTDHTDCLYRLLQPTYFLYCRCK